MPKTSHSPSLYISALLALASLGASAAEQPYYNPANPASSTGKTTDYTLYKTIGCPGQGLLETACDTPVSAPREVVAAVITPEPAAVVQPQAEAVVSAEPQAPLVALNKGTQSSACQFVFPYQGVTPQNNPWLVR